MIPQLEGKSNVSGAETTDEVVFEGLDGAFCRIRAVVVGFNKLDLSPAGLHEGFYGW